MTTRIYTFSMGAVFGPDNLSAYMYHMEVATALSYPADSISVFNLEVATVLSPNAAPTPPPPPTPAEPRRILILSN